MLSLCTVTKGRNLVSLTIMLLFDTKDSDLVSLSIMLFLLFL